jgi:hypothetical protein
LDYLKCSEQKRKEYEAYKESLHYQASMYETNYTAAKMEITKSMLAEGLDMKTVIKITELTEEMILQ